MNIANNWNDYKILDMADGQKLENGAAEVRQFLTSE